MFFTHPIILIKVVVFNSILKFLGGLYLYIGGLCCKLNIINDSNTMMFSTISQQCMHLGKFNHRFLSSLRILFPRSFPSSCNLLILSFSHVLGLAVLRKIKHRLSVLVYDIKQVISLHLFPNLYIHL